MRGFFFLWRLVGSCGGPEWATLSPELFLSFSFSPIMQSCPPFETPVLVILPLAAALKDEIQCEGSLSSLPSGVYDPYSFEFTQFMKTYFVSPFPLETDDPPAGLFRSY